MLRVLLNPRPWTPALHLESALGKQTLNVGGCSIAASSKPVNACPCLRAWPLRTLRQIYPSHRTRAALSTRVHTSFLSLPLSLPPPCCLPFCPSALLPFSLTPLPSSKPSSLHHLLRSVSQHTQESAAERTLARCSKPRARRPQPCSP
eukprot:2889473-Rhodomonas_salina.2